MDTKLKEYLVVKERPDVKWEDIAGLDEAKNELKEYVILPHMFPHMFKGSRALRHALLLYGLPGTGKSYLTKAVAKAGGECALLYLSLADLVTQWYSEAEKVLKTLFTLAQETRPNIIVLDHVDALSVSQHGDEESKSLQRIRTEFTIHLQGVLNDANGISVIGITNQPWVLDATIRRRFLRRVYVPLPDAPTRRQMFQLLLPPESHSLSEENFEELSQHSGGLSGEDISKIVRTALERQQSKKQANIKVTRAELKMLISSYRPTIQEDDRKKLQTFTDELDSGL